MSVWKDEADFMKDIEQLSEFYISGNHNKPCKKFVIKTNKQYKPQVSSPWYESDSEEELGYTFGKGKKSAANSSDPGQASNHLEVMREIQLQVRSAVGNRYNNDVLETYYNVCKDDAPDSTNESPSCAPKEVSIIYAKEQNLKNSSLSPTKENRLQGTRYHKNDLAQTPTDHKLPFSSAKNEVDVNSKSDFPSL